MPKRKKINRRHNTSKNTTQGTPKNTRKGASKKTGHGLSKNSMKGKHGTTMEGAPTGSQATNSQKEELRHAEQQFRLECVCQRPLYVTLGHPRDITININTQIPRVTLKLVDRNEKPGRLEPSILNYVVYGDKLIKQNLSLIEIKGRSPSMPAISEEHFFRKDLHREDSNFKSNLSNRAHSQSSHYGITFGPDPLKVYNFGERGSGTKTVGPPQNYQALFGRHSDKNWLFEDPEFPPDDTSVFFGPSRRQIEWKRPHELVSSPKFFVDGYSRFDIQQGDLGDCWLLAATANLTMYSRLFNWVVPVDQDFDQDYCGIFHFRFWYFGRWVDVCVDDNLPVDEDGELIFLRSTESNEFWSALLEKAYAKLHGCYDALSGGATSEAMEDFTGGMLEEINLKKYDVNLFEVLNKAYEHTSLMGCYIEPKDNPEDQTPEGLVTGHAYSITKVAEVEIPRPECTEVVSLVRLRNPWGNELEWNGAWSDGADEWKQLTQQQRTKLGLTFEHDGEFWMTIGDFAHHFDHVEICNLNPDTINPDEINIGKKKVWDMSVFEGEWVIGCTAGGCRNHLSTFWHNPQYRITLEEVDDNSTDGKCTIIIALMQKHRRLRRMPGNNMLTIGFAVYRLLEPDRLPKPLDRNFFKFNQSVAKSAPFINTREVVGRFKLPPGTYCIVPSTFEPNKEGEFLIRVFAEKRSQMEENDQEVKLVPSGEFKIDEASEESAYTTEINALFHRLASDDDGELDWSGLKTILDEAAEKFGFRKFSKDICRSMIAMVDYDRSGKLNFQEFKELWMNFLQLKKVFREHDVDHSLSMSGYEMRDALLAVGYMLNARLLNILMHRYGNKNRHIDFDDFVNCVIKLHTMIAMFEFKKENESITLQLDEWLESTLYS